MKIYKVKNDSLIEISSCLYPYVIILQNSEDEFELIWYTIKNKPHTYKMPGTKDSLILNLIYKDYNEIFYLPQVFTEILTPIEIAKYRIQDYCRQNTHKKINKIR